MAKKRMVFCTILSLSLIAAVSPAETLASPRAQLERQTYSVYAQAMPEQPQEQPAADPRLIPDSGTGGTGGSTTTTTARRARSGGFLVAPPPPPAPAPAPAPAPVPPPGTHAAPAAPSWMTAAEAQAFNLLNETRIKNGVPPVQAHQDLTAQARLKAIDMVENNYFSHTSPTYGSAANMVRRAGIPFSALAENLSMASSVYRAHLQLEFSTQGHRQIMLNANFNYVGIAVVPLKNTPGVNMVQIFIRQ
jgi:uncharacterized protein YkwD